jgi:glutamine cyclotransferase
MKPIFSAILLVLIFSCNGPDQPAPPAENPDAPKPINFTVGDVYPHDTSSFTEGILFYKGELYESTGLKGKSRLLKVDLKTGKTEKAFDLDAAYFGEGIAIVRDTVYQLTYQEKVGFMYSLKDFRKIGEFKFASEEGWGMTFNGKEIIASDGTSNLRYYEPGTFRLLKTQPVYESGSLAYNINELEYIDGYIYANQWQRPFIFKIDPATGQVVGKMDLSSIDSRIHAQYPFAEAMNGIAYDETTGKMYITGKNWPELIEVKLVK